MTQLPPNPYTLGPIKRRDRLAGRSSHLKELEYYLGLTRTGQSPHIALIGQRGVGKTSLLMATSDVATDQCLLPVSIDLNESKVQSAGVFWHDLYSTLTLAAASAGCWGGKTGKIYTSLLGQLYQRKAVDLEFAVLQFPIAIASHNGDLGTLLCPDALIVHDFAAVREELQRHGKHGIALLLDEGDCLGAQRGLLQMLRNFLQRVEGTCFVIAGTDSLFDVVSDVFSPIPRQFHRMDVFRFSDWTETLELLRAPIPEERSVWPSTRTVVDLHEVCQGNPTELQLYCHHMYKAVEHGLTERMEMTPGLYRAVRGAYRAHSQAVDAKVLDAIDELPDALLINSRWLRRRRLSLDENVELERLRHELRDGRVLSTADQRQLHRQLAAGYKNLYERGISSSPTSLDLIGGTVTAGYWKSLVQTERTARWAWIDNDFARLARNAVVAALAGGFGPGTERAQIGEQEISATEALQALRAGRAVKDVSRADLSRWMLACVTARERHSQTLIDVSFRLQYQRTTEFIVSYVGTDPGRFKNLIAEWIADRTLVFQEHEMEVAMDGVTRVSAPTDLEVSRLARVARIPLPTDTFGPGVMAEATRLFLKGDTTNALVLFEIMLRDRDDAEIRNNLAYCLMTMGRASEALAHIQKDATRTNALRRHNLGMAEALNGDLESARKTLRRAWELRDEYPEEDEVLCMLLLSIDHKLAGSVEGIPLQAGLLINMLTIGANDSNWCIEQLAQHYGKQYEHWLGKRAQ